MGSVPVRVFMALLGIAGWVGLALVADGIARDGWSWFAAALALFCVDVGAEFSYAAWRGRAPDVGLLVLLLP